MLIMHHNYNMFDQSGFHNEHIEYKGIPLRHLGVLDEEVLNLMAKRYYPDRTFLTAVATRSNLAELADVELPDFDKPCVGEFIIQDFDTLVYKVTCVLGVSNLSYNTNYAIKRVSDGYPMDITDDNIIVIIPPFIFDESIDSFVIEDLIVKSEFASRIKLVNSDIVVCLGNLYVGDNEFAHELLNGISIT